MRKLLAAVTMLFVAASAPPRAAEPNWHLTATVAESCSCTVSCPCNFGGEPTKMPCHGNRMISINAGHFEDVDLAGIQFLVTFSMREWSKIYVSDKVSEKQMAAVEKLMPIAFAGFQRGMLSFTKAPITMNVSESRVTFSGPESSVEMDVLKGFGGKPVKVMNLPSAVFQDYTQYKSVTHKHASDKTTFSYSGTNGFTSTMDVGSKP
jgi:hypothetical protein